MLRHGLDNAFMYAMKILRSIIRAGFIAAVFGALLLAWRDAHGCRILASQAPTPLALTAQSNGAPVNAYSRKVMGSMFAHTSQNQEDA